MSDAKNKKNKKQADKHQKEPGNVMHLYYRIDQEELERRGLGHKSEIDNEQGKLTQLHQFSLL